MISHSDGALRAPRRERPKEPSDRHLRLVESSRRPLHRGRVLLFGGIAAGTIVALALVYLHVVLAQRQFRLDGLNSRVQQEQAAYQDLRLKVAELGAPQHIISMAEGQLHMVQPAKVIYLTPPAGASAAPSEGFGLGPSRSGTLPSSQSKAGNSGGPAPTPQLAGSP